MTIEVNGVQLYYEKTGSGPPVVLVHGNSEDHTTFQQLAQRLAPSYTVYAPDSRDHGQSTRVPTLAYEDMMEDMAAFITALGLQKPLLVGASDGAIIGLLLAIRHPGLLGGLVSCGANTQPEQLNGWFLALARLGFAATKDSKLQLMLTQPRISGEELGRIRTPTLVLAGSRDILAEKYTRQIAAAIPGSELRILKGKGHSNYISKQDTLYHLIVEFTARHPVGSEA